MEKSLEATKDDLAKNLFGLTVSQAKAKGICIECKQPPTFYSDAGKKEYQISGLCEPCFDRITTWE